METESAVMMSAICLVVVMVGLILLLDTWARGFEEDDEENCNKNKNK